MEPGYALLFSILMVLKIACSKSSDFYIKEWKIDNNHNLTSGLQVGGWDIKSQIFYILGGNGNQVDTTSEYIYDPSTGIYNVSNTIEPTSTYQGQQHTTIVADNGSAYIYFENTNYEYYNLNFYIFDMDTNVIKQGGEKPTQSIYECFTSDDSYIYIIGGIHYSSTNLNYFSALNISSNVWYKGNELNVGRVSSACIVVQDNVFVFGGDFPINTPVSNGRNTIETMNKYNGINGSDWIMTNEIIQDIHLTFPTALKPDNSNTVFIISASVMPNVAVSIYSFDSATYKIEKCNESPLLPMINGYLGISGYIEMQHRFYLFGYQSSFDAVPLQYAVLHQNKTVTVSVV